jgi:hypothetical protein
VRRAGRAAIQSPLVNIQVPRTLRCNKHRQERHPRAAGPARSTCYESMPDPKRYGGGVSGGSMMPRRSGRSAPLLDVAATRRGPGLGSPQINDPEAPQASRAPEAAGRPRGKQSAIPALSQSPSSLPPRRDGSGLRLLLRVLNIRCRGFALTQERVGDQRSDNNGPHQQHASRPHRDGGAIGR